MGRSLDLASSLLGDVDSLLEHHPAQRDPKRGRPAGPGNGPLLRAGTSLCYTAWEVYVEESLLETVEWLTASRQPDVLPTALRDWAAEQRPSPWLFAEGGWRDSVLDLVRARIEGDGQGRFGFNTASVPNVESLYKQVLGYSPLRSIRWQKKSNAAVRKGISELVEIRGEIVHKGSTPRSLTLGSVRGWADFVRRLAEQFDSQMVTWREASG